jgi:hypothetical protein
MSKNEGFNESRWDNIVAGKTAAESLISVLSGVAGDTITEFLVNNPDKLINVAQEISNSTPVEYMRKLIKTSGLSASGRVEADFSYVGLPSEAESCDFTTGFSSFIYPRLAHRADSFKLIFEELDQHESPFILETGCLRVPNNWAGDGQSTFVFDWYARENHGHVVTIDISSESIESARRACSGVTSTILNDSVAALHMLDRVVSKPVSFLYLDSFDLDQNNPMPSAIHHAMELMAARSLIGPGTIICVDDYNVGTLGEGGKGMIINSFMDAIRADVLYSGYQKIWRIPG